MNERKRERGRLSDSGPALYFALTIGKKRNEKKKSERTLSSSFTLSIALFSSFCLAQSWLFTMGLHLAAIVSGAATLVGAAAFVTARTSAAGWRSLPALALSYASATGLVVALAAHPLAASRGRAALLGKRESDGSLPLWSLVAFAPFHAGLRTKLAFQRARGTESNWDEVEPLGREGGGGGGGRANGGGGAGRELRRRRRRQPKVDAADNDAEEEERASPFLPYYLGGWPHEAGALPPGVSAVLDVTAELPRIAASGRYLNLRVWDTHGPTPAQIDAAVRWIAERRREGEKVLVHCAHGHGRSVTVLAAALLAEREEEEEEAEEEAKSCSARDSVDSVIAHIQKFRPRAKLNSRQREALEGWLELRKSAKASVK